MNKNDSASESEFVEEDILSTDRMMGNDLKKKDDYQE